MFVNWIRRLRSFGDTVEHSPSSAPRVRLTLEAMEDRTTPARLGGPEGLMPILIEGGELRIAAKGAAAEHVFVHFHPEPGVGGLNTAEAQSGVVIWTPTDAG